MGILFHRQGLFYRATVRSTTVADGKIVRRVRGGHEYAHVRISVEPLQRGKGFEFVEKATKRLAIPARFLSYIASGVFRGLVSGFCGFPATDIRVIILDGSYHDVDSTPGAFEDAAALAITEATRDAKPVLLEPVVRLRLRIPEKFVESVLGDLISRRARVEERFQNRQEVEVIAAVPQSELGSYAAELAVLTGGFATYSFCFVGYEDLPDALTVAFFCPVCKREMTLPRVRGEPYSQKCLVCDTGFEPPNFGERVGVT